MSCAVVETKVIDGIQIQNLIEAEPSAGLDCSNKVSSILKLSFEFIKPFLEYRSIEWMIKNCVTIQMSCENGPEGVDALSSCCASQEGRNHNFLDLFVAL